MACVDKLLIQGIRSFSPQAIQTIEFYKPLTLIVGENGAGKTTIIECLRFATSSELPPNAKKNHSFVHDPKLAGQAEVRAKIALKFHTVTGKEVTATQLLRMSLHESGKLEFKRNDSTLKTRDEDGTEHTQSAKCAEFQRLIPELMGVSSAVLESVIFCHQEDSNWPLSEATKLKNKFDNIFSASRYRTALETIKKQKKEYATAAKEAKLRLDTEKEKRKHVVQYRADLAAVEEAIEQTTGELENMAGRVEELELALVSFDSKRLENRNLRSKIAELKTQADLLRKKNQEFFSGLAEEYTESNEDLLELKNSFERELSASQRKQEEIEVSLKNMSDEKRTLDMGLAKIESQFDAVMADFEEREKKKDDQEREIVLFGKMHELPSFSKRPISEANVQEFLASASAKLQDLKRAHQEASDMEAATQRSIADEISALQQSIAGDSARVAEQKKSLTAVAREIATLKKSIAKNQAFLAREANVQEALDTKSKMLEELKSANVNDKQEEIDREVEDMEGQMEKLRSLMDSIHENSQIQAQLSQKQKELERMEEELASSMDEARQAWPDFSFSTPSELHTEISDVMRSRRAAEADSRKNLDTVLSRKAENAAAMKSCLANLAKRRKEEKSILAKLDKAKLDPSTDMNARIAEIEDELIKQRRERSTVSASKLMYEKFVELALAQQHCPLCEQAVPSGDLGSFVDKLSSTIEHVPQQMRDLDEQISKLEDELELLKRFRPEWEKLSTTVSDIQRLDDAEVKHTSVSEELSSQLSESEERHGKIQQDIREIEAWVPKATVLKGLFSQKVACETRVEELQSSLERSTGSSRTADSVKSELNDIVEQCKQKKMEAKEVAKQVATMHRLSEECGSLRDTLRNAAVQRDQINQAEKSLQKQEQAQASASAACEELKSAMSANEKLLAEKESQLRREKDTAAARTRKDSNNYTRMKEQLSSIEDLNAALMSISVADLEKKKSNLQAEKMRIREAHASADKKEQDLVAEKELILKKLSATGLTMRNLDDNIKYREQDAEVQKIMLEKEDLEKNLEETGDEGLDDNEIEAKRKEHAKLKTQFDKLNGKLEELRRQKEDSRKKLASQSYKSVDKDYRHCLIEMKTTELACEDLGKYYKAVDRALMRYHSMKMEEINRIIKELWQATYSGQDIDTIEIRSDVTEEKNRRTYDYRVVMIKQGVELDMRGRCSAGQKVLCSLIIRLALAETFCLNCGIIALDEPTTNLDRHNVEAFALALVNLINMRSQQRQFQLIVITHDEEFVQLLGRSEHAEYFWRVTKNEQGHSTITRNDISSLG